MTKILKIELDNDVTEEEVKNIVAKINENLDKEESAEEVTASEETTDTSVVKRPTYNMSADVFGVAYAKYQSGSLEEALELCAIAMESDGIEELMASLEAINDESEIGEAVKAEAAADTDVDGFTQTHPDVDVTDEDGEHPKGMPVKDNGDGGSLMKNADGGPKTSMQSPLTAAERLQNAIASVCRDIRSVAEDSCDDTDDEDEEDEDESDCKMESRLSQRMNKANENKKLRDREQRALANKISLSGSEKTRKMAANIYEK